MKRHSNSFIVTMDNEDNYHLIDHLEKEEKLMCDIYDKESRFIYSNSRQQR